MVPSNAESPSLSLVPPSPAAFAREPAAAGFAAPAAVHSEIVVEVEANRSYTLKHADMLVVRFRNEICQACTVAIQMRLSEGGYRVAQNENQMVQRLKFERRGEQHVFSFPFEPLKAGRTGVEELRVLIMRPDQPGTALAYELPDQSLFIDVADPAMALHAPGVVIHGGITVTVDEKGEKYASKTEGLVNINAPSATEAKRSEVQWKQIRLRLLGETVNRTKETMPRELRLTLPRNVPLELVRIPAGEFVMGTARDDERPEHRVNISREFYLSKFLVTQEQYKALMDTNPSKFQLSPRHPVDNVSWDDAQDFCRRLRAHLNRACDALEKGTLVVDDVSLPTEAEWEYACRAGTTTPWSFGDDRQKLLAYGWFYKNSKHASQEVGQLQQNPWGLFDMHGNLCEWCADYYAPSYADAVERDPQGPARGDRRVLRGGSWSKYAADCRSACRHSAPPSERTANYGFRIVLRVSVKKPS
jgi:formylglycine-generating enzyme required for sulfatase activity